MSAGVFLVIALATCVLVVGLRVIVRGRLERELAMASLRPSQRRQIRRSVMHGTAVRGPDLAAPAVELAKSLQQRPRPHAYFGQGRRRVAAAVVLGGVALVSLLMEQWINALFFGVCAPCIIFAEELIWAPERQKRAASIVANGG